MLKRFKIYLPLLIICFALLSCEKENDHGSVHIVMKYNGQLTSQPLVYMKSGTLSNPGIPLAQYEKSMSGDGSGQVTFENLAPGNYFFYGKAYGTNGYVTGEIGVTVRSRYRQNWYDVTINGK